MAAPSSFSGLRKKTAPSPAATPPPPAIAITPQLSVEALPSAFQLLPSELGAGLQASALPVPPLPLDTLEMAAEEDPTSAR